MLAVAAGVLGAQARPVLAQDSGPTTPARRNRPPRINGSQPRSYFEFAPIEVRWGKEVRFAIVTSDPDGDAVTLKVQGLPAGARFTPETNEVEWTPGREAIGRHELRVVASDGHASTTRLARLTVVENRPPTFSGADEVRFRTGQRIVWRASANDPDGDPLRYQIAPLPPGARFDAETSELAWNADDALAGSYPVTITASDGQASASRQYELEVQDEWSSRMLPGVAYSYYRPGAEETLGVFHGVALELVLVAWIHRNDNRGPSHGRLALKGDVLDSSRDGVPVAFAYALGVDLSLERNPRRRWLIPFFGLDAGGFVHDASGHRFQVTPRAGVHLWASRNIFLGVGGGYLIAPFEMELLRGWRLTAGANLTLW